MKRYNRMWRRIMFMAIATVILAMFGMRATFAQDASAATPTMEDLTAVKVSIDTAWVLLTGFLVFFMQCGFAMLETGLIHQKGAANALLENFIDAGLTALCWWAVGFGIAFGTDSGGIIGTSYFFPGMAHMNETFPGLNISVLTMFFFQFAFAATASTITTGAMAERTDFIGDLIYSALIAIFIYPVVAHWAWGGGWLSQQGFHDFAGSTVVHTVGGVIAIWGAWMLGPRKGKVWGKIPPAHNLGYATLGTMILWFGWYGFNPGSTLGAGSPGLIALVTLNTTLGAAGGAMATILFMYARTGKWDLAGSLNGTLAGLVAITAPCAFVEPWAAVVIGLVAGILVILAADVVEKIKVDDPVGAFAVHGANGIWGTIAIGIFAVPGMLFAGPFAAGGAMEGQGGLLYGGTSLLGVQVLGSLSTIIYCSVTAVLMFGLLKVIGRLRVHAKADEIGIDNYEHGVSLWPDVLPPDDGDSPAVKAPATAGAIGD
ncbi:MAG: ammonium transporter [Anaerolineae bacterium]